jgi:type I restriction enzyme S subunit
MKFSIFVKTKNLSQRLDSNYYSPEDIEKEELIKRSSFDYLGNRTKRMSGGATPKGANYLEKGIAFIRTQNIQGNLIDSKQLVYISTESNDELKRSQLKEDDVLLTITGVDLGHSAVVPKFILPANINQHSVKIEVKNIDPYFLSVFLNSTYGQSQIWRRVYGATRPALNYEEIQEIIIPIPLEDIQKYIGNKIRKAEELREEAKQLKEESESILNAVLKIDEFKYEETKSWIVGEELLEPYLNAQFYNKQYLSFQEHLKSLGVTLLKMEEILSKVTKNSSPDEIDRVEKGIPSLIVSDIDPYRIETNNSKIQVSQEYYKKNEEQAIQENDVVYTTAGPPLGEACLVVGEMLPLLSGAHVAALRLNEKCQPGYLACVLNSIVGALEVQKHSYGIRQQYLFNEQLLSFIIPVISRELQEEIHQKISTAIKFEFQSNKLISSAKQDVEDLIEGKFDESKISEEVHV